MSTISSAKAEIITAHQNLSAKLGHKVFTTSTLARRPVAQVMEEVQTMRHAAGMGFSEAVAAPSTPAQVEDDISTELDTMDDALPGEELATDDDAGLEPVLDTSAVVATPTDAEGLVVQRVAMGLRAPAAPKAPRAPRQVAHPHHMVIRLVATSNPKRAGTPAHEEWEMYVDGMTVAEYIKVVRGASRSAQATRRGYNGVAHDVKKGFIRLEDPNT